MDSLQEYIDDLPNICGSEALIEKGRYDLVGITGYSSGATRAYEIAHACRKMGVRTIMGGPHASACPDEAGQNFDSVAIGECDEIWPELIVLLKNAGISEYSIFLDESTHELFAVLKTDAPAALDTLPEHPVMQHWWAYMKDIMATRDDDSPVTVPLREVFYLN